MEDVQSCELALSHGRTPVGKRPAVILWATLAAAMLMSGCVVPGMKLDVHSTNTATTTQVGELNVTLRSVNSQVAPVSRPLPSTRGLEDLLVAKVPPYLIGPQDILLITVWDHPEITLPLGQYRTDNASGMVVDEDGTFYFPYANRVYAKGLTVPQVREKLTAELSKTLRNPQVDVKVIAFRSQKVYVGGEVRNPANYNVTDVPFTLSEAVNRAGGLTPNADDSQIVLTRAGRSWTLNFLDLQGSGNPAGQVILKDGDSLQVPNALEAPIYLMGELVKPGSQVLFHGKRSLAQAISEAGGILGTSADARSIYVIRAGATAKSVDVFHLDARNPTTMVLADRFALQPRDFVYVDAGTLVRWSRVMALIVPSIEAVTGIGQTAANLKYVKNTE